MKKSEFETHQKIIFINITENVKERNKKADKKTILQVIWNGQNLPSWSEQSCFVTFMTVSLFK